MIQYLSLLGESPKLFFIYLLCSLLAILISITVHEWAHAFVAYKLGDPTARNMGRMSLDPTKHIDPVGLILFILLGFGWAKPVMINSRNLKSLRRDDVLISLAGPAINVVTGFIFCGLYVATLSIGNTVLSFALNTIASYNIVLAFFNLIPIYPLDGSHVLSSLLVGKEYQFLSFMQRYGYIILIALIVSDVIDIYLGYVLTYVFGGFLNFFFMLF